MAGVASGPTCVASSIGSPTSRLGHGLDEAALELVGDAFVHDEALGGDAALAVVDARAPARRCAPRRRDRRWA